jgi:Hint module
MQVHFVSLLFLTLSVVAQGSYLRLLRARIQGSYQRSLKENDSGGDDSVCDDDTTQEDDGYYNTTKAARACGGDPDPGPGWCFSAEVPVRVFGKGEILMEVLGKLDRVHYERVYAFSHRHEEEEATFVQIITNNGPTTHLEMTPNHMIFVDRHGKATPVAAGDLKAGDLLIQGHSSEPAKVVHIQPVRRKGIYAPLTHKGHFLANGMVVSAYVSFPPHSDLSRALFQKGAALGVSQHTLTHFVLTPFRMICGGGGVELSLCSVQDRAMPWLMEVSIQAIKAMNVLPQWLQWILFAVLVVVVGGLWTLEMIWSCGWILAAGSLVLGASHYYYSNFSKPSLAKVKTV